ncbi:hypothetical protein CEXT_115301, partial [Caerostris extrusa]
QWKGGGGMSSQWNNGEGNAKEFDNVRE